MVSFTLASKEYHRLVQKAKLENVKVTYVLIQVTLSQVDPLAEEVLT
jgi:hypothetical protein